MDLSYVLLWPISDLYNASHVQTLAATVIRFPLGTRTPSHSLLVWQTYTEFACLFSRCYNSSLSISVCEWDDTTAHFRGVSYLTVSYRYEHAEATDAWCFSLTWQKSKTPS